MFVLSVFPYWVGPGFARELGWRGRRMYPGFARGLGWIGRRMYPGFALGLGWRGHLMYPGFARGLGWRGRRMCFSNSDNSSIAVVPARTQTHSFNFLRHVTPNLLPFLVSFMWLLLCFAATAFSVAALTIVFAFQRGFFFFKGPKKVFFQRTTNNFLAYMYIKRPLRHSRNAPQNQNRVQFELRRAI